MILKSAETEFKLQLLIRTKKIIFCNLFLFPPRLSLWRPMAHALEPAWSIDDLQVMRDDALRSAANKDCIVVN